MISIHALLTESDYQDKFSIPPAKKISIHALLTESDVTVLGVQHRIGISIHALLTESDHDWPPIREIIQWISIHALLTESDACILTITICTVSFLSTLSLRRATRTREPNQRHE